MRDIPNLPFHYFVCGQFGSFPLSKMMEFVSWDDEKTVIIYWLEVERYPSQK
jgi:hypothetical protein